MDIDPDAVASPARGQPVLFRRLPDRGLLGLVVGGFFRRRLLAGWVFDGQVIHAAWATPAKEGARANRKPRRDLRAIIARCGAFRVEREVHPRMIAQPGRAGNLLALRLRRRFARRRRAGATGSG
jgi:hypothetical protein